MNPYSPMEILAAAAQGGPPTSPTSHTSDDGFSRRTSMESVQTPPNISGVHAHVHPPTAFKVFSAFKRSRSSLTIDQDHQAPSSPALSSQPNRQVTHKKSVLRRKNTEASERPRSIASNTSTTPNSASMRSAVTAAESISSSNHRSRISADASGRLSRMTSFSAVSAAETERDEPRVVGEMPKGHRDKRRDRESGCSVQ